jgi:LemA protein
MSQGLIRTLVIGGVIVLILIILYRTFAGSYNNMVAMDEGVKSQWAQVENVYQRRADLIPNLVNTVKGYADFEQETLTRVVEARAKATSVTVDPSKLNAESIAEFQAAQNGLSSALGRLLVTVEKYPDLKANQNFLDLQTQLEGTENRITVERNKFNDVTKEYNTYIKRFPQNLLRGMYGFEERGYFEATKEGAENAPEVKF